MRSIALQKAVGLKYPIAPVGLSPQGNGSPITVSPTCFSPRYCRCSYTSAKRDSGARAIAHAPPSPLPLGIGSTFQQLLPTPSLVASREYASVLIIHQHLAGPLHGTQLSKAPGDNPIPIIGHPLVEDSLDFQVVSSTAYSLALSGRPKGLYSRFSEGFHDYPTWRSKDSPVFLEISHNHSTQTCVSEGAQYSSISPPHPPPRFYICKYR